MDDRKAEVTVVVILQWPGQECLTTKSTGQKMHSNGSSKFMEDCETGVLAETRCGTEESDQKLQSSAIDWLTSVLKEKRCRSGTCPMHYILAKSRIWNTLRRG